MVQPYLGEIRTFGGNFAPLGWALCDGSLLSISDNQALFALIGTTYGGNGVDTFALPDLRGRLPLHQGQNPKIGTHYLMGQTGGSETVTLTAAELPIHTHQARAQSAGGTQTSPSSGYWAGSAEYASSVPTAQMSSQSIGFSGDGQPHDNMMPFLPLSFIIALVGVFPSQN